MINEMNIDGMSQSSWDLPFDFVLHFFFSLSSSSLRRHIFDL